MNGISNNIQAIYCEFNSERVAMRSTEKNPKMAWIGICLYSNRNRSKNIIDTNNADVIRVGPFIKSIY
jgi:hypothetical protein